MNIEVLIKTWFDQWEKGNFLDLPITESFKHTSPFGTINGKDEYISLVEKNKDKFLGYQFKIQEQLFDANKACVRYKAIQGGFSLDVSEWYYIEGHLIKEIIAHYHIGEIRDNRKLSD